MSYVCRPRAVYWRPWRVTWQAWRGGSPGPGAPPPPRGDTGEGRDTSQAGHSNTTNSVLVFILFSIFIYFIFNFRVNVAAAVNVLNTTSKYISRKYAQLDCMHILSVGASRRSEMRRYDFELCI